MSDLVYGSLFSGYEGLTMGVQAVLPGRTAWVSDIDKGSCKLLAHRFPDVPNLGDISTVDWSTVEPVDVLTGGFPCQDVSAAGKRAGIRPGTRSGLWAMFAYAISQLRPRLVVIENVRGLLSAKAHSDVEPCAWCVGDDTDGALRALGAVLGDLASLGYDASWHGLRAGDVGAPHGRFRVFIVAYPQGDAGRFGYGDGGATADTGRLRRGAGRPAGPPEAEGRRALRDVAGRGLLPTPTTRDHKGRNQRDDDTCLTGALLPTPRAGDGTKGGPNQRGSSGDLMLPSAVALLPTPLNSDAGPRGGTTGFGLRDWSREHHAQWGEYAPAIHRWESITRDVPAPTELSTRGTPRLAPAFVEWMMGLPAGWITDTPGLSRNEMLKLCGNGVVPQQAEAALRYLLNVSAVAA